MKVVWRHSAKMYALRHSRSEVWYLSPYEFWMYWEIVPAKYAATSDMIAEEEEHREAFHCKLTASGTMKVIARGDGRPSDETEMEKLTPGEDSVVKENTQDAWWIPFPDEPETQGFRHTWVIK